jgi:glycosyltransferase involved in cell wall biosynthesis
VKIVHVPFTFGPDPVGGTEVYVQSLCQAQRALGLRPLVAAPGARTESYTLDDLTVHRFAVTDRVTDVSELYGAGDPEAAARFGRILDREEPDVVHLHALTRGASLALVRQASARHIPSVFTYHTPTVSCPRGTLLRWGTEVCDGVVEPVRCAECRLQSLGVNRPTSRLLARTPGAIGRALDRRGLSGGAWTALAMRQLVGLRHETFIQCMVEVRHVVAVCEWARAVLERNGVPRVKITVSRAGVADPVLPATVPGVARPSNGALRAVFLGRLDPTKGVDLIIRALRAVPDLRIALDVYGVATAGGDRYSRELRAAAAGDPRIVFHRPIPSGEVIPLLRDHDVVLVPSRLLETGPLVVLEAFAAGTPVIGSALGGIAELISDGVDGLLVRGESVDEWREALERVARDRELLSRLRRGIRPPRSMADVADDMMAIYGRLFTESGGRVGARSAHSLRPVH